MLNWILSIHGSLVEAAFTMMVFAIPALPVLSIYLGIKRHKRSLLFLCAALLIPALLLLVAASLYAGSPHARTEAGWRYHDDNDLLFLVTTGAALASVLLSSGIFAAIGWLQRRKT